MILIFSVLTHFERLGPGQLREVAEVGFVLDDGVVVDDGLGDAVLGVEPEVEHLIKALHDRLRVKLELDNVLGKLNRKESGLIKVLKNVKTHHFHDGIGDGLPDRIYRAGALGGPELGQAGQLVIPDDFPHVGGGGDAVTAQGPVGDLPTVPDIQIVN